MIIVGSRTTSVLVAALVFSCRLCHTTAAQRLLRVRQWFTLFFAPILPFGHGRYVLQYSFCGQTQTLDRESADRFLADADAARDALRVTNTLPAGATVAPPPYAPPAP